MYRKNRVKTMKITRQTVRTAVATLAMGCFAYAASASVTYQINNGGLESFNLSIDGNAEAALAGGLAITRTAGDTSLPANYVTLCTDIEGVLVLGQSYVYDTPVTPFSGQTGVKPTWGALNGPGNTLNNAVNAAQAIQNAAYLFYNYGNLSSTGIGLTTTTEKAALQLAVWSALYNTALDGSVSGSRFSVTSGDAAAITMANNWLSGLTGNYDYAGYLLTPGQLTGLNPPQGLLIAVPVPEPTTVIAGLLLLLPLGASTIKIVRRKNG